MFSIDSVYKNTDKKQELIVVTIIIWISLKIIVIS